MKVLLTIWFICFSFFFSSLCAGTDTLADHYAALAIQGDLGPARDLFREAGPDLSPADRELAARFDRRFIERTEPPRDASGNALIDAVIAVYRDYWINSLLAGLTTADSSAPLQELRAALKEHGWPAVAEFSHEETFAAVEAALAAEGVHALAVPAPPLQDLLIWVDQTQQDFEVELTDQTRTVRVVFMSDLHSAGWKHFATLGLVTTTGWVDGGALYCVEWAYAPGSETFEVSYLKHETRHLADFEQFPGLSSAQLEYRAKLTELAFANSTQRRLLDDFTAKSAPNPDSPHALANYRVTRELWRELFGTDFPGGDQAWMSISPTKVNRAARRLLASDTAKLTGSG
jgi:hypothetical protein